MSVWVWSGHLTAGAGAVGAYTLAADPGSYSITGTDAALVVGRVVVADAGTVAITGTDATLARGYVLVADAGTVAITGVSADLLTGRVVGADAGAVAITGTDATLARGLLLVADAGSYAITGTAADLQRGYGLVAESGSVTITGVAATFLRDRIIVGGTGLVEVLGGGGAGLLYGRVVAADAGAVAITGTAADLLRGYSVAADAGSYSVTGVAADLLRGYSVAADAGSIAITGTAADLLRGYVAPLDAGTVTITGTAADLVYGTAVAYTLAADAGSVTVAASVKTLLTYRGALLGLPLAELHYPRIIQPSRWATNGRPPDIRFLRALVRSQNHAMAYRRKTFLRWGDLDSPPDGLSGDVTRFRWRCHTGYGATHIGLVLGLGLDNKASGASPAVQLEITPVGGGAATTVTSTGGASTTGTDDYPSQILWRREKLAVLPNTTYECRLITKDYGRIVSVCAYEIASPFVDPRKDYYVGEQPGVEAPVTDSLRERILVGLSSLWRRNGSHLYSWPGDPSGTQPTFATSTWTNIIDGSTTSSSSTPGFALGDADEVTLLAQPRRSKGDALDVVLAAHGSMASGSGGEVRLIDNNGTAWMTLTGIGTTSQWYATTGTISLDGITKLDAQARATSSTLTLNAVSLYTYA